MKLQISPVKKIDDAIVMWFSETKDTDIVADPRYPNKALSNDKFKVIYCFGLLGYTDYQNIPETLKNLSMALKKDGELYIIENDFDYLNRAYLGGDLKINEFNTEFIRKSYLNQYEIVKILGSIGFNDKKMKIWFSNLKFKKAHYEFVLSAKK